MSFKKRLLRIFLVLFALGAFVGYFLFATLLFKPFEADYEFDVAALIPARIDFYVSKAGLKDAFDGFPRLAAQDRIEKLEAWQVLEASPEYHDFLEEMGIDELLRTVEDAVSQIPLGMEPQDVFGGRDVALAGNFVGGELSKADWAVYGRVNWAGKLAVAALEYPGLIGLSKQGLAAVVEDDHVHLSGQGLERPLFVTRIRDVVIAATTLEMVQQAHKLAATSGAESLFGSAAYNDHIRQVSRSAKKDEIEVLVDVRALLANMQLQGPWPDTKSERFIQAFAGRMFQAPSAKSVIGVIGLHEGLQLDLYGGFSSELVTPAQTRIYRARPFDRSEILRAADFAPTDAALFAYVHGPVADLLQQVFASVEPALRENLEDAFRSTGQYESLDQLIQELANSLHNRLVFILRANDYPPEVDGPEHDDTPVFAMDLVTWYEDIDRLNAIRDTIGRHGSKFGLQGKEPGDTGYFSYNAAGYDTREFWSPFVPGTGIIATMNTEANFHVSNNNQMLSHVLKTRTQTAELGYPSLAERGDFQALVDSALPSANILVWFNPREAAATLRLQAARNAELDVEFGIDWETVRGEEERKAIAELFPGKTRGQLSQEDQRQLDTVVDPRLRAYRDRFVQEQVPVVQARLERDIAYLEAVEAGLLMLRLDPKEFRLSVRVRLPLDS